MTFSLITQLNEHITEQQEFSTTLTENHAAYLEGIDIQLLCEDAARQLANITMQLGGSGRIEDVEKAVDIIAGLRILGSNANREVLNVRSPLFKLIVQRVGDDTQIDRALDKIANHPSFKTIRDDVESLVQSAIVPEADEERKQLIQTINKLRIGYERVAQKLGSVDSKPTDSQDAQ